MTIVLFDAVQLGWYTIDGMSKYDTHATFGDSRNGDQLVKMECPSLVFTLHFWMYN